MFAFASKLTVFAPSFKVVVNCGVTPLVRTLDQRPRKRNVALTGPVVPLTT